MANEEGEPPSKDYERMSLGSLKRELEVQKTRTETAREEARERMRAQEKKAGAFPWGTVAGIVVVGVVALFGLVYALRESFPSVAGAMLPIFVYVPSDTGPPAVFVDAARIGHDAGMELAHPVAHHPHTTTTPPPGGHDDLGLGDLGGGSDPIEGVGSGTP